MQIYNTIVCYSVAVIPGHHGHNDADCVGIYPNDKDIGVVWGSTCDYGDISSPIVLHADRVDDGAHDDRVGESYECNE